MIDIIDTIKPKNNGTFPVVEAIDVAINEGTRLPDALASKADTSSLAETAAEIGTALTSLQSQIDQIEISASAEAVVAPEVAGARVGADGESYETLKERLDAENNDLTYDTNNLPFICITDSADVLRKSVKHDNTYIPRITDGKIETAELEGYCYYEVKIPENRTAVITFKKQTHMETGQQIVLVDDANNSYLHVGYSTEPSQSYFHIENGYISILLGNLLSRSNYEGITKVLLGYTSEDEQICNIERGKTSDSISDAVFPYGKAGYPFIGSADFNDGTFSKASIRNAITDIRINAKGCTNPYIKSIHWDDVNVSFFIIIGATKGGESISVCSFHVLLSATGMQSIASVQSAITGEPVGVLDINVDKIIPSEITTRNMGTHDYYHFGIAETAISGVELIQPFRYYSIAGLTCEWFLQNCLAENRENFFLRFDDSTEAHYNANYDRRHSWISPINENRGGGAVKYKLSGMDGAEHIFEVNYLRAAKTGLANRTVKALFIGDSLIDNNHTITELKALFDTDESGAGIEYYGTRGTVPYKHEGHAGWSTYDMLHTVSYNDRNNAFINPVTGSFDFSYYCVSNSIPELDYIAIQIGVNDIFRPMQGTTTIDNLTAIIDNIHAYMPNAKILLATLPQPYLGGKYDCLNFRPAEYAHLFRLNASKDIYAKYKSNVTETKVYVIPIHAVVDTEYDFAMSTRPVNADSEVSEQYCSDITHYTITGHKKVARQYYAAMKYIE